MKHLIIDGSNVLWRSHWVATQYSQGYQYQDVSVFISMIHNLCVTTDCYDVYIAWDDRELRHEPNPRRVMLQEYKQNRSGDSTCYQHIDQIKRLTMSLGMVHVRPYAFEGDDVISILCDELPGHKVVVSADQDLAQLVSEQVSYYSITKKTLITPDNFTQYFPVPIDQYVTYKCIIGDTSDNIVGVPRFGPKRAAKLAQQIHTDASVVDPDIINIVETNRRLMDLKLLITDQEREFITRQINNNESQVDSTLFHSICQEMQLNKVSQLDILRFIFK